MVAVELKVGEFKAEFKGQMELYLRWLAKHERSPGSNPRWESFCAPAKSRSRSNCWMLDKSGIHVAEYLTVLPPRATLQAKLQESIAIARQRLLDNGNERSR